jgi:integrase
VTARHRRPRGEGCVFGFRTRAGEQRFGYKFTALLVDGRRRQVLRRRDANGQPWTARQDAADALREAIVKAARGNWTEPSRQPVGEYLSTWLDGLRLAPSTIASYRKNIRLHIEPYIGALPLASLTSARLTALYRELEKSGRRDQKGERTGLALSARTVRYIHTIISAALAAAVEDEVPLLERNPAAKARPPTAREARAPEMHPWSADQLRKFLDWSAGHSQVHAAWHVLAMTGMRRGELLALRWRDIDLGAGTIAIRRSVGVVKTRGQPEQIVEGGTKTCRPRVIDLDPATAAVLRAWKSERGAIGLHLARSGSVVFGNREGGFRHPETFARVFRDTQERCARMLGEDAPPRVRLHDLRHSHATILLRARENVKVVSERLGHASVAVTLGIYSHVLPGDQRETAARFAALVGGAEA